MPTFNEIVAINHSHEFTYLMLVILICQGLGALWFFRARFHLQFETLALPRLRWIIALGVLVRLPLLLQPLWYDETFSGNIARLPWHSLGTVILADVHPPLYYTLLWMIVHLIDNEIVLRLPALLFGLWAIKIAYEICETIEPKASRMVALIMAIAPTMVWYSSEARQYALFILVVLIAVLALQTNRKWLFVLSVGLFPWLHALGIIYCVVLGLWGLKRFGMLPMLAAAALAIVWLPFLLYQSRDVANGFWLAKPSIGGVLMYLTDSSVGMRYGKEVALLILGVVLVITFLAITEQRKRIFMMSIAVGIPALLAFITYAWHSVYLLRALLPAGAILLMMVGIYLYRRRLLAIAYLTVLIIPTGYMVSGQENASKIDMHAVFDACKGLPVLSLTTSTAVTARYYVDEVYVVPESNDINQALTDEALIAMDIGIIKPDDLEKDFCLVWVNNPGTSGNTRFDAFLWSSYASHRETIISRNYYTAEIYIVER